MPMPTRTLDESAAIARGAFRAIPGADVSPGSDYDIEARMVAALATGNQAQAEYVARQAFPRSAEGAYLEAHIAARGLTRMPAAKATGKVQLVGTGSPAQADGSELEHDDGTAYVTTSPATLATPGWTGKTCAGDCTVTRIIVSPNVTGISEDDILAINTEQRAIRAVIPSISAIDLYEPLSSAPGAGAAITAVNGAVATIEASEAGADGNKLIGDTLTLSSPATGVTATVRILDLAGGGDRESDDEMRTRCVDFDANRPGGGNSEHLRLTSRETPGVRVDDAIVYPCFRGLGTVDIVLLGVSGARRVSDQTVAAVQAQVDALVSETADVVVEAIEYTSTEYDVDVTITTELGYERDYVDTGKAIDTAPVSTTTRVYLTATLVGIAEIGDRVLITQKNAGWWKTYERTITSVQASGSDYWIDLDEALPAAPVSTDPAVLPSGPLAAPAIAALESMFDALGPSRRNISPAWTWERHPLPAIAWDDTVRLSNITSALKALDGCADVSITTPSSNQQPGAKEVAKRGRFYIRFTEL